MKLTTHLHLVPRSRMSGAIHPFSHYFMAWCSVKTQGHVYLLLEPIYSPQHFALKHPHSFIWLCTVFRFCIRLLCIRKYRLRISHFVMIPEERKKNRGVTPLLCVFSPVSGDCVADSAKRFQDEDCRVCIFMSSCCLRQSRVQCL